MLCVFHETNLDTFRMHHIKWLLIRCFYMFSILYFGWKARLGSIWTRDVRTLTPNFGRRWSRCNWKSFSSRNRRRKTAQRTLRPWSGDSTGKCLKAGATCRWVRGSCFVSRERSCAAQKCSFSTRPQLRWTTRRTH